MLSLLLLVLRVLGRFIKPFSCAVLINIDLMPSQIVMHFRNVFFFLFLLQQEARILGSLFVGRYSVEVIPGR